MTSKQETYRPAVAPGPLLASKDPSIFNNAPISYGLPFYQACARHVDETFHAKCVYILASATLARKTSALKDLQEALGDNVAGIKTGLKAHTSWNDAVEVSGECRKLGVDLIVTLGGGSLTDLAKLVSLALANNVTESADFHKLPTAGHLDRPFIDPKVPVICIPTTLSAGEYNLGAGATDDATNLKHQFLMRKAVQLIILDGDLVTKTTPMSLWLASGIRSVDHCTEALCSLRSNEVTDMHAEAGLRLLVPGLLRCKADKEKTDVEARHLCQMGAIEAIAGVFRVYTPLGGSHAIGHMLGPFGVGHGETSCILLPAVCKYNARHGANVDRQQKVLDILWSIPELCEVAESRGLKQETADLGETLDAFIRSLGMPRTLKEVNVGREKLDQLAEYSLKDTWMETNPVPLREKAQVMEILEIVAE